MTVQFKLNKLGLYGRTARKKKISNKNMAAQLGFAKLYLNEPHNFWNSVFGKQETKPTLFGHND